MPLTRSLFAASGLAAVLVVAGCGGGSSSPKAGVTSSATSASTTPSSSVSLASPTLTSSTPPTSTGQTSAAQTSSSAPPTSVSSVGGDCGNATVEVNKATNASPESDQVLDIELKGGCAAVTLATVLMPSNSSAVAIALRICQVAATPAYHNGVLGVSVLGVGGKELAAGTRGSSCVATA